MGVSGPPSNTWFPGPTQVHPNGSSIGAAVSAGLTSVTDRQTDSPTDHATRSVRIGRIYVRSAAYTRRLTVSAAVMVACLLLRRMCLMR